MARSIYDVKRKTETMADGVPTLIFTNVETRSMEVQPVRFSAERGSTVVSIELGGESYVPSFRAFVPLESVATATDRITNNSGATDLMVLRTYDYEDHKEMDLKDVVDNG